MSYDIPKGSLRLYGCGGFGVNRCGFFMGSSDEPQCAQVMPAFIDTSRSNFHGNYSESDVFILENTDGSGKVRRENHEEIANVVKKILLQVEPGDFNAVVFSASGGSGSVIGPLLMAELMERGLPVVGICVGSDESVISAQNTMNTLKSLDSVAKRCKYPAVVFYEHNDKERKRSEVDAMIHLAISTLSVLTSRQNREMDTQDIKNWVQFNRTTTVAPQLAQMEVFIDPSEVQRVKDPISVASIYESEDIKPIDMIPEYHAAGYLQEKSEKFDQLHYVISVEAIPSIYGKIKETLDKYNNQIVSRVKQTSVLDDQDNTTDTGLVL